MSAIHTDSRRTSSEDHTHLHHHHQTLRREDVDDTSSLLLSRTRSQDFSAAESVALQESLLSPRAKRGGHGPDSDSGSDSNSSIETVYPASAKYLVMMCALLTSLSFGVTQVPLLYVFRLMTCDAYYQHHPSPPGVWTEPILSYTLGKGDGGAIPDRCSIHAIESSTALSVSLLGASTTVFGLLNLFLAGSLIKRIGVKRTLVIQVFFPALRLLVQNVGVEVWGNAGIIIIQCSQIVSILGGPSGYLLVLNTFITEVVEYEGRTAALGQLTGSMMFGSALGFLLGGVVAESFGIKAPFRLTLALFLAGCAYVVVFLPHIPPARPADEHQASMDGARRKKSTLAKLFSPLAVFAPGRFIGADGVVRTEYGAFLLAWGVFLGILATGEPPSQASL